VINWYEQDKQLSRNDIIYKQSGRMEDFKIIIGLFDVPLNEGIFMMEKSLRPEGQG